MYCDDIMNDFETPKSIADKASKLEDKKEALKQINLAITMDSKNSKFYYIKAGILESLKEFDKSFDCYNQSLELNFSDDVFQDKLEMFKKWEDKADDVALNSILDDLNGYDETYEILCLKGNIFYKLNQPVESQKCWYRAFGQFDKIQELDNQIEYFKNHPSEILINITGTRYYEGYEPFKSGMILNLKKDHFNAYDKNAICVCAEGKKLGHVANSEVTLIKEVKSASEIYCLFDEEINAEFLFFYLENNLIARLIL